jgi:hypothetical protein
MQEMVTDELPGAVRPILGSGFVSNGWSSAMLEEGPGMIAMGLLLGAFCGLVLGLITLQAARFLSFAMGRNLGAASWALISMALGAIAFGVMIAADRE